MNEEERIIRSIKYIINQNYVDTEDDIIGILIKALNLIEKQDKIIQAMAEYIDNTQMEVGIYFKDKNEVIKYFEKEVRE